MLRHVALRENFGSPVVIYRLCIEFHLYRVVCDTAKVRFFKQATTGYHCRFTGNGGAHGLLHLLWGFGDVSAICLTLIVFSC